MSVATPKFRQAMASSRARKRELLVRLLQREEMKDAMFKELQIKHGSGFFPSKEIEEKTDAAVNELLSNNFALEGNEEEDPNILWHRARVFHCHHRLLSTLKTS